VFARFGNLMLCIALFCAIGGHWVVLQSVAWTTMLADHARSESLGTAVHDTFDGQHPCRLCCQIARARQAERKTDLQISLKQLEFLSDKTGFVVCRPSQFRLLPALDFEAQLLSHAPPTPPPRSFIG
jgi:hypothetical protein